MARLEALFAAGASASYDILKGKTQETAESTATEVAKYVYTQDGTPEAQAASLATETVRKAKEMQGGSFQAPEVLHRHGFSDCWEPCGKKPGYCSSYCGVGNACCRKTGDIRVPPECRDVSRLLLSSESC